MNFIEWLDRLGSTKFEKMFKSSRQTYYDILSGKRPASPRIAYMIVKATNETITYDDIFGPFFKDKIVPVLEDIEGNKQLSFFDKMKQGEGIDSPESIES